MSESAVDVIVDVLPVFSVGRRCDREARVVVERDPGAIALFRGHVAQLLQIVVLADDLQGNVFALDVRAHPSLGHCNRDKK